MKAKLMAAYISDGKVTAMTVKVVQKNF